MLIGLFPELDAPGGVQRASRHMAAVMSEFASTRGMECRLISLNDSPELHRMTLGEREFVFTGCDRAKGRFVATALRVARRKVKVVLAAHANLGPLVQAMRVVAPRLILGDGAQFNGSVEPHHLEAALSVARHRRAAR